MRRSILYSRDDINVISHNEGWVKSNTELANNVGTCIVAFALNLFDEFFRATLSNGSQIID